MLIRLVAILIVFALTPSLSACKLTSRLPYYRESNKPRPAEAEPYEVHREQPYPRSLIDASLHEEGIISRSLGKLVSASKPWVPEDVAKKNRSKIEMAIGRPIVREKDRTHPIHADPFPEIDVILAISGGGHRAANIGSAVIFELSKSELTAANGRRVTVVETVDTVSSVSGGGFAAAFFIYHRSLLKGNTEPKKAKYHEDLIRTGMRENIQTHLLDSLAFPTKISFWIRAFTQATRTNLYSNLIEYRFIRPQRIESLEATLYPSWWRNRKVIYRTGSLIKSLFWLLSPMTPDDQYLFGVSARTFDDLFLREPNNPSQLYPLRPEWLINSTAFSKPVDANQFLFDEDTFNELNSDWMSYRVSDAVAASAAFPVALTPLGIRNYGSDPNTWEYVFDGGVSDNQGMNGVRRALERKPDHRRAIVIMIDASPRSGSSPMDKADRPGGMDITNRAIAGYMDAIRADGIRELREHEEAGNFKFFYLSIRSEEFGAPLTEEQKELFERANKIPTALKISREDQSTLFAVGKLLVERDREAIVSALTGVTSPTPRVHPPEKSPDDSEP